MNSDQLASLKIDRSAKRRSRLALNVILLAVAVITALAVFYARPWAKEGDRVLVGGSQTDAATGTLETRPAQPPKPEPALSPPGAAAADRSDNISGRSTGDRTRVLTVSGYIVNRERIELSPRFLGVVKWIGVKKGDAVTNGQVVVLLDDAEYQAQLREIEARRAHARIAVTQAEMDLARAEALVTDRIEMQKVLDDARLALESAHANVAVVEGQLDLIRTYLDWTVIRSPIDGVVLEKLVDPNELVTPQSFGGTRGPSTALISVADPQDLQVEIDLNERDVSKAFLGQHCRVSPEAYPDHTYDGYVAEMAPEANRQKGTLQIKVQIVAPDRFLTPELSARVDFLPQEYQPDP